MDPFRPHNRMTKTLRPRLAFAHKAPVRTGPLANLSRLIGGIPGVRARRGAQASATAMIRTVIGRAVTGAAGATAAATAVTTGQAHAHTRPMRLIHGTVVSRRFGDGVLRARFPSGIRGAIGDWPKGDAK